MIHRPAYLDLLPEALEDASPCQYAALLEVPFQPPDGVREEFLRDRDPSPFEPGPETVQRGFQAGLLLLASLEPPCRNWGAFLFG